MLPSEFERFCVVVSSMLRSYGKAPTQDDLQAWWDECKGLSLDALQSALKAHKDDPDRGERAPRPVDVTRRMKAGAKDSLRCAARDMSGQCEYPGIFSEGTSGEGSWFCPWHRLDRAGPEASRWIEVSRQVPYETACAKRMERMHADSIRAPGVVDRSHAIALRHGDRPWQTKPLIELPQEKAA